jgi:hypothetical protein
MVAPKVVETCRLSAHRRQVALVRWSLVAAPAEPEAGGVPSRRDPLRAMDRGYPRVARFPSDW